MNFKNFISFLILGYILLSFVYNNHNSHAISEKIDVVINYAHFISPLNNENQIKIILTYLQNNDNVDEITNKSINAIMKIYSTNGTLLKTSSFPHGFIYNVSEPVQLATNIVNDSITSVNAILQLTNLEKTQPISDPITINLTLGQVINKK
jgi:hypothetical protein